MADTNALISLEKVVTSFLFAYKHSTEDYSLYLQHAANCFQDFNLYDGEIFQTAKVTLNTTLKCIELPDDCQKVIDLVTPLKGEYWSSTLKDRMVTTTTFVGGVETRDEAQGEGAKIDQDRVVSYGAKGGWNKFRHTIDMKARRIYVDNNFTTNDYFVLLYVSSGINASGDTTVPSFITPMIDAYLLEKETYWIDGLARERDNREAKYFKEKIKVRSLINAMRQGCLVRFVLFGIHTNATTLMSNILQETVFPGTGLNWDDAEQLIPLGDSPYMLNVMISGNEASGIITNILGNSLAIDITDHKLELSRTYNTIASCYNSLTRKAYYWVFGIPYDSGGGAYIYDNRLFQFNEDEKTLDLIFTDTKNHFGLDLNHPFKDSSMLGDWLFFNSRVSEPKVIDVLRAFNYTNYDTWSSTGTYTFGDKKTFYGGLFVAKTATTAGQSPVTHPAKWERIGDSYRNESDLAFNSEFEYAFNVLKMPPIILPSISYGSDTDKQVNNVRGKVFRFSYRYKYFDNTYSAYSGFSDITLPEDDEVYNGEILNTITTNNYIRVAINAHSPALIKEVEVVVQEISGNWKRIKIINRQEQAELTTFDFSFNFYNNESYVEVTNVEVAKVMDFVPKRTNSMEIINKNILAYGGCLEGFDNIPKEDIRVGLTPVLNNISIPATAGIVRRNNKVSGDVSFVFGSDERRGVRISFTSWFVGTLFTGDQYKITIDGQTNVYTLTASDASTQATLIGSLMALLNLKYPAYYTDMAADYLTIWSPFGDPLFASVAESIFSSTGTATASLTKKRGFKTGANHPFCLFYYDENLRRWDAQVSKENLHVFGLEMHGTTVYVPMFNEVSPPPDSLAYRWTIDWEVYHLPPEGAKYWRWGYAGNSLCSKMVQYIVSGVTDADAATYGANLCQVDIKPLQTLKSTLTATWNQYSNSIIDSYTWTQGDRIRFITKASVPGAGTTVDDVIDGVYEYEILKQDATDDNLIFISGTMVTNGITAAGIGENSLVEIYTPTKSISDTKTLYYEFGELMPIIEDSAGIMVHAGQNGIHNQDTALSHTAIGTFEGGDIYHIMRTPSKPISTTVPTKGFFHESMWYSDFYDSDDWDKGKIGIETSFGERFLNIVRYSRPYFQNTLINGLSTFEEDLANSWAGYKEYNDVYGDIMAIYEHGNTLKVYQERKQSSTLIGRTEYEDAQGNITVAISNVVLGAIRWDKSNYSTIFPESISRNNSVIYGFDIHNGVAWRDGSNGIFPISGRYAEAGNNSDYKMQTYFKLKSKALMESGLDHVSVLGVWDEEYKCFYLTFKDYVVQVNNDTIVFHEPSNRWITFTEFKQTPINGFNTPLELTYEIVKGFDNGIGYSFNEETRFAHFDIGEGLGTSAQTPIHPESILLRITVPLPSISISANVDAPMVPILIIAPDPTIHVSYVTLTNIYMQWTANETGLVNARTSDMVLVGTTEATITGIPPWLTVLRGDPTDGAIQSNGYVLGSDTLTIYPPSVNTYEQRTANIVITDTIGNTKNITCTFLRGILNAVVQLEINSSDVSGMILSPDWSTTSTVGYSSVTILSFSVTVPINIQALGQDFELFYVIVRSPDNGITWTNDISSSVIVRNGVTTTNLNIQTNAIITEGELIKVLFSAAPYTAPVQEDADIDATEASLILTVPTPTILVTSLSSDLSSYSWVASNYGLANAVTATLYVEGGTVATFVSKPDWIEVVNTGNTTTSEIIYDGGTVDIYPKNANNGTELTGDVVFTDETGNQLVIAVTHQETIAPPLVVGQINPASPYGADGMSYISLTSFVGTAVNNSPSLSITFVGHDPSSGMYVYLNLDYVVYINSNVVATGTIFGIPNDVSTTQDILMSINAVAGNVIFVYFGTTSQMNG